MINKLLSKVLWVYGLGYPRFGSMFNLRRYMEGQLAEETARVAANLPDGAPADVAPLSATVFAGETRSRLAAAAEMLRMSVSSVSVSSGMQLPARDGLMDASSAGIMGAAGSMTSAVLMATSTASACAGALQLLHPSTHAELLRLGTAAGLAAQLTAGPGGERKATALLAALTVAADAGYARGVAAVCRALWVEGTADSAASVVALQALPVIARLLAVPRMATRCEAAWGFSWIGRLRSSGSRRRPVSSAGADYRPHEAGISAAERESIVPLLELLCEGEDERAREGGNGGEDEDGDGDGEQAAVVVVAVADDASESAGVGRGRGDNIDITEADSAMNVAEAAASALYTMAAVPSGAVAILDADLAPSALMAGLGRPGTRRTVLALLLACAKRNECKARIVAGGLLDPLLMVASSESEARADSVSVSFLARHGGVGTKEWWESPGPEASDGDAEEGGLAGVATQTSTAVMAARTVMLLFDWSDDDGCRNVGHAWLVAPPKSDLREPASDVINRAQDAAVACLVLAQGRGGGGAGGGVTDDWRAGWCHDVHSAAIRALAATACTAACQAGGAPLPAHAQSTVGRCSLTLSNQDESAWK